MVECRVGHRPAATPDAANEVEAGTLNAPHRGVVRIQGIQHAGRGIGRGRLPVTQACPCRLRRWAHMLRFGGHFLTKNRQYSVTFRLLREARQVWQRALTTGPEQTQPAEQPTTLVVNFSTSSAPWHNTGDALLTNSATVRAVNKPAWPARS